MKRKSKQWWSTIPPISNKTTNQLSPSFTEYNKKKPRHITLEIQIVASIQPHKCGGFKLINGIHSCHLGDWISNGITYIFFMHTIKKNEQLCFHLRWPHTITTIYDSICMYNVFRLLIVFILSCYSVWYVFNILYIRFVLSSLFIKCNSEMKYWQTLVIIFIVVLCYIHITQENSPL